MLVAGELQLRHNRFNSVQRCVYLQRDQTSQ
ncbi:hypothetical protein PD5205_01573 [Xanthomonas fragariae]|uniref:Uncharacterized protein n=1 Tax=Xanthomonas fragariae TaxID=48664 RepID=A0A1Y6H666_9XANT|nr:hypothetical protein NBC2815_01609 [Xanthomonas fragariae]SMQ98847.1 hypothetical protein PD885_01599 [Xanthomonas fragariae]SMR02880.1 hypothetical protein PD5205_01573 [Xanthomonas fragariae]